MTKRAWLAMTGLLAAAVAAPAAAQDDRGLYFGGSIGYAGFKNTCKERVIPCEDNDTAWRAFAGYQFNRNVALEAGYADLGEATGSGIVNTGTPGTMKVEFKDVFDFSGLLSFPIVNRLHGFGRLGLYRARTTVHETATGFPDFRAGESNSGFTYGAGVDYRLGFVGIRAEWQHYDNVGGASTGEDDIDVLSVGFLVRF
jgi:OOP family OmpA-OmpF porin